MDNMNSKIVIEEVKEEPKINFGQFMDQMDSKIQEKETIRVEEISKPKINFGEFMDQMDSTPQDESEVITTKKQNINFGEFMDNMKSKVT